MRKRIVAIGICALGLIGIGAAPRYLEELRIGGGYGDAADGGADFDKVGNIVTDGSVKATAGVEAGNDSTSRGVITAWDGAGLNAPGVLKLGSTNGTVGYAFMSNDRSGLRIHSSLPTSDADGEWVKAKTVTDLSSPPAIGGGTPNTGKFTTLQATGKLTAGDATNAIWVGTLCDMTIPPAIGGTTPAAGKFTTLQATGIVTANNAANAIVFGTSCSALSPPDIGSTTPNGGWFNELYVQDTATLGPEVLTNGDMELDSDWVNYNSPTTNARSAEQAHGGTYSRKVICDSLYDGLMQTTTTIFPIGSRFTVTGWMYNAEAKIVFASLVDTSYNSWGSGQQLTGTGAWQQFSFTGTATTNSALRIIFSNFYSGASTFYIDDVSVKQQGGTQYVRGPSYHQGINCASLYATGNVSAGGGGVNAGIANQTRGVVTACQGSGGNTPAVLKMASAAGITYYFFVEDDGTLKVHNALPTGNSNGGEVGSQFSSTIMTFTANDTTPSVLGGLLFRVPQTWTAGNNITMFDNADAGQQIVVIGGDTDCVVVDGGHLKLAGNWTATSGKTLSLVFDGTDWYETARADN